MVENIVHEGQILSIIVRNSFNPPGISFFTPDEFSQQLALLKHKAGKVIQPHVHNPVLREVKFTQEVLVIKRGRLRVDFFDDHKNYIQSAILGEGDVILLASGGHGFEVLEDAEIIEIKQGPYTGDKDKTRFEPAEHFQIKIISHE